MQSEYKLSLPSLTEPNADTIAADLLVVGTHGRTGFRPFEISLLGALWIVPLLARSAAGFLALPVGFLVIATFYAVVLTQVWHKAAATRHPNFAKT